MKIILQENDKFIVSLQIGAQIGSFADEELVETVEDRFIAVDFDFDTLLSSSFCSFTLFAIVVGQLIKLEFLASQVELK